MLTQSLIFTLLIEMPFILLLISMSVAILVLIIALELKMLIGIINICLIPDLKFSTRLFMCCALGLWVYVELYNYLHTYILSYGIILPTKNIISAFKYCFCKIPKEFYFIILLILIAVY